MANKKISELPYIGVPKISGNTLVPLVTYFSASTGDTVHTYVSDLQAYIISGITGNTSVVGNYLPLSGGTVTGSTIFTNGITANTISATTYQNLPPATFSGGTVTGPTIFTNGLTANTISATTYQNLPTDIRVTGGTYSAGTVTFTNNTGGTFNVTGLTTGSTSTVSGDFLPLSGGTVTGQTFFTSGLTITGSTIIKDSTGITDAIDTSTRVLSDENGFSSVVFGSQRTLENLFGSSLDWGNKYLYKNDGSISFDWENGVLTGQTNIESSTISATTYYNLPNTVSGNFLPLSGGTVTGGTSFTSGLTANTLNVTGLTQTSGITSTGGIIFPHKTITANYTATTSDYFINITGGTFDVTLQSAVGVEGKLLVVKNEGVGIINVLSVSGQTIDDRTDVLLTKGNSLQIVSDGKNWVILGYNISSTQANTGVIQFSGLSIASPTTFTVGPAKGFIVDDTTNPVIPFLTYVDYSGGTYTATYVTTSTETWIYLSSGGTISQSNVELTEKQRRQGIALGKLGHANKTSIINAFNQPDFVLSPLGQLRDMFQPIGLINGGIRPSPNGANLSFNTNAGYIYGLGINFVNDPLSPDSLSVSGTSPCTFQYRTQTGGTASNTTLIDATKYDVGGVVTTLSGTKATNQRIYLVQNGQVRVQYGQVEYANLATAIANLQTESYVEFSNFTNNGILIGILSVLSSATDLTDLSKAQFFNVSKFGDSAGAAGGAPTTNLQQAYNNSTEPEILINSTLDGLSIKNGTGNADNVTKLLEGLNTAGSTTSYIRADGLISGNSLNASNLIISGGTQSIFSGNSSSDLVRITQAGVGNAFVVDDSTNPDTTPFVINSGGSVSIGTTSVFSVGGGAETKLNISTGSSGVATTGLSVSTPVVIESTVGTSVALFSPDATNSQLYFGTPLDAFGAYLRWDYTNRNLILSTANGTGKLIFQTQNSVEAARIDNTGNMGIGLTGATQKLEVSGNTRIYGGISAQTATISGTGQSILTVIGSGNSTTSPIFSVQGSSGELFSVTDSLVGSLFSVNDISGLPIVEVFSDNTTLWGSYQAPSLNTTTRTSLTAGTNTIYSIPTSAYTGAFYEYTLISTGTTGARAGQIMSIWSGTSANFTETSTLDIGTTTGVTFTVAVSGSNAVLSSSATTAGWTVKTIIRSI